jgi:hypothetical protein
MSKYHSTVEFRVNLITRMYQDHGYDIDDIVLRLRYPRELVETIIEKYNLNHGKKFCHC